MLGNYTMPAFIVIQLIDKLRHLWAGETRTRGWSLGDIWESPSSAQRAEGPFGGRNTLVYQTVSAWRWIKTA